MMDKKDNKNPNRIRVKRSLNDPGREQMLTALFSKKRCIEGKKAKLVAALLSCRGLQHIIDVGYEVLGNPMFVSDLGYHVLAFNKNAEVGDPSWPTAEPETEFEAYERIKKLNDSGVFERLYASPVPCIENFDYSSTRWMAHKLTIKEKNIGHIAVVEAHKIFADMDLELLQFLCSIVASELQKENIQSSHFENEYEHFLLDLLEEKITRTDTIQKQAKKLNLNSRKYSLLVTISPDQKAEKVMSLSYLKTIINRLIGTEKSIVYHNKITILLQSHRKEGVANTIVNKLRDFLATNEMRAGISPCFQSLTEFKIHYRQSIKALELGTALSPQDLFYDYNAYAVYHLLETAGADSDLKAFCNPVLFDLIDYDRHYQTDYQHNLYIHLLHDGNVTKTAQYFQIHRNSMKYRIKKIEEILNISLADPETKFSLRLSFKILNYLGEEQIG